jgi:uncharacterized protein (TIGR02611 family)
MKMFNGMRRSWRLLGSGKPGDRFERFYRNQQEGHRPIRKFVSIVIGVAIVAAGLILLPAPGPGMLVVALGFGLLAREFLIVARALDWIEPKLRKALAAGKRLWQRSSALGRAALVLAAAVIVGAAALAAYQLMFAD